MTCHNLPQKGLLACIQAILYFGIIGLIVAGIALSGWLVVKKLGPDLTTLIMIESALVYMIIAVFRSAKTNIVPAPQLLDVSTPLVLAVFILLIVVFGYFLQSNQEYKGKRSEAWWLSDQDNKGEHK